MTIGSLSNECQSNANVRCGLYFMCKDWQMASDITSEMRGNIVEGIVEAILPGSSNYTAMSLSERRRCLLFEFARKIENDHFHTSDSKEEYFLMIMKKIKRIRRQFQERQRLRNLNKLLHQIDYLLNHGINETVTKASSSRSSLLMLNTEFRQQIVKKIVFWNCSNHTTLDDVRLVHLVKKAQKLEAECLAAAKTRDHYLELIEEKKRFGHTIRTRSRN